MCDTPSCPSCVPKNTVTGRSRYPVFISRPALAAQARGPGGAAQGCSVKNRLFLHGSGDGDDFATLPWNVSWIRQCVRHRHRSLSRLIGQQPNFFHLNTEIFHCRTTVNHRIVFLQDLGRLLHDHQPVIRWYFHYVLGRLLGNEQFVTNFVVHGRSKLVQGRN